MWSLAVAIRNKEFQALTNARVLLILAKTVRKTSDRRSDRPLEGDDGNTQDRPVCFHHHLLDMAPYLQGEFGAGWLRSGFMGDLQIKCKEKNMVINFHNFLTYFIGK